MGWTIANFILVSLFAFHSLRRVPQLSLPIRIRHFIAAVAVSVWTWPDFRVLVYALGHPQLVQSHFYVPEGSAPAWLAFSFSALSTILGSIVWSRSYSLAARKPRARSAFLWLWPFVVFITFLQVAAVEQEKSAGNIVALVLSCVLAFVLIGGFGLLLDWHFRSKKADVLFMPPNKLLQPTATALSV